MRLISILLSALLLPAAAAAADPCRDIVSATVAELRAGSAAWDEAIEALVRSAAGSSCVKAMSGTYAAEETSMEAPLDAEEKEVEVMQAETQELVAQADTEAQVSEPEDGKAGWKFLGFEVNAVSGSPGQKPYERKR